jgi:hypothetical protein
MGIRFGCQEGGKAAPMIREGIPAGIAFFKSLGAHPLRGG